jgi:UDP-2,4-diacetamido-2,4,6-trideoxy-beta-L-altropyranose hydrolase
MRIAFRTDASVQIGTGHVMRCLTLAEALAVRGAECLFLCRAHPGNLIEFIRSKGHVVHALLSEVQLADRVDHIIDSSASRSELAHGPWLGATQAQDAAACKPILAEFQPDWLIVDHYALDVTWELTLKPFYSKMMVIDDLADRVHTCDILLDQTFGRNTEDYRSRVSSECRLLCGAQYALLRPEFMALRPYSLQRRALPVLRDLLITMGGVDKDNATGQVLQALLNCPLPGNCRITVVMGATAPYLNDVLVQANHMPWTTRVLVGVSDMAQLMADSDLAIGAAGSTAWELCCLGVPTLLVCTAANQLTVIGSLAAANATVRLDRDELGNEDGIAFSTQYAQLTENLKAYSAAAIEITDGNGASRVCSELVGFL